MTLPPSPACGLHDIVFVGDLLQPRLTSMQPARCAVEQRHSVGRVFSWGQVGGGGS